MANTNGTDQRKLEVDLVNAFLAKEYQNVTQSCEYLPDGPLQKIGIYEDTVLHMAAHSKQRDLVLKLLNKLSEDRKHGLAEIINKDGNTILHEVATSDDMKDVAKEMVNRDPKLLIARNELGETPIFCAARHGQTGMFMFLAEEMDLRKQGPEYLRRNDGTTVLHISVTTESFGLAYLIAKVYPDLITKKDQESMTALRYLACNPSAFEMQQKRKTQEFIQAFISSKGQATTSTSQEEQAWGSISFKRRLTEELLNSDWKLVKAMKKSEERVSLNKLVKLLVKSDASYCVDAQNIVKTASKLSEEKEGQISQGTSTSEYKKSDEDPLFLATISNIPKIVKAIIMEHPRALEHTNEEGMNILHVAILYRHIEIFDMVKEKFEVLSRRLLSARDKKGDSLLHMVGRKRKSQVNEKTQNPALQLRSELLLFEKVKKACKVHVTMPLNKENKTAEELFAASNVDLHKEAKEWLTRSTENCTILSVFIATVAFAAAYTVPGGPDQSTGIPILNCKPFFVVFIIADVISLTLALTSVGIFLAILTSSFSLEDFKKRFFKKLIKGIICLIISVSMMAVAFGATIILIMKHNWKNIVWDVVAFLPVPIFFLSYSPLRAAVLETGIGESLTKVVKSIKVVALVLVVILFNLIFYLFMACIELKRTVTKACGGIRECVRSICGKKSRDERQSATSATPAQFNNQTKQKQTQPIQDSSRAVDIVVGC